MTTLLFDIDNTLLNFDKAEYFALGEIFKYHDIPDTKETRMTYSKINKELWAQNEAGEIDRLELLTTRFSKTFEALGVQTELDGLKIDHQYENLLSQSHELMFHAQELLDALEQKNVEMYVVSNGTSKVSRPRIVESGIDKYFREIFISEEVGFHKPSQEFFTKVFDHIENSNNKDFTIIGDSLSTDIQGGKNAGIHTIWYNPKHLVTSAELVPEYEIKDLLEIPTLLHQI